MDFPKSKILKLASIADLVRLVITNSQNRGAFLYYGIKDDQHILAVTHLIPGWYDLRGLPITLVAVSDLPIKNNFIAYQFGNDSSPEKWEFVDHIIDSPKVAHIPIIKVDSFPEFMLGELE